MNQDSPPPSSGPSAWFLGLVGLAMLIIGHGLSTWTPPRDGDQQRIYDDLRALAGDTDLGRKVEVYRPRPPFEFAGRIVFFIGLGLFVTALATMWRTPEPAQDARPAEVS